MYEESEKTRKGAQRDGREQEEEKKEDRKDSFVSLPRTRTKELSMLS